MSDYSVFRKYTVERYDVSSCGDMNCEPLVSSHDGAYVAHEDYETLMKEAVQLNLDYLKACADFDAMSAQRDQLKAENKKFDEGMRSMACSLGAGGYNAETLTADQLVDKVQWGLTNLADSSGRLLDQVRAERDQLFGQTEQLKAESEALRKLAVELRGAAKCYNLHHCKAEQHAISEPCKVLARIDAAMTK